MSKQKKFLLGLAIILIGVSIGGWIIYQHRQEELRMEAEREAELEIIYAYLRLHYAFAGVADPETLPDHRRKWAYKDVGRYEPMGRINEFGIEVIPYLALRFYYHRTGIYLSYELIEDYFSSEFEPDGSLRLYNNGNHPEMEAFVTWMWEGRRQEKFYEYLEVIGGIRLMYIRDNEGSDVGGIRSLSPQMLDALTRAEADPDYVLDLTSLQEQGY